LIAAPAGYGKTTLAAQWTAQLDRPLTWLALDEADDDPLRFCTYFVAALQRVRPAIGAELLPALLAGQLPPQAALVTTLLNDLDAALAINPSGLGLICVLDDFHAVQDPAILGMLQDLLAHPLAGLHLALVTREDPALPLARQPTDVQQFLLDTSILARLSGDLCDGVAGRGDSAGLLERLLAANLFVVPLDDEGRWYRYHHLFADLLALQSFLAQAQGNLAEAEATLAATGIPAEAPVTYRTDAIHLAWLRWMIAGHHPQALALAGRIVQNAEADRRHGTLIQALVLGAKAGGGPEWLGRARQLAAPEGYQRIFIDEALAAKAAVSQDLVEPLTERELEALHLLAEGLTYAEIAQRLVVSVNTVRFHVKEIYGKLGVNRQAQAVARAREVGLL
jgi:ATP/maltotriose-dependent transcriptional regulator MalT